MSRLLLIANPASSQFTGGTHRKVLRILSKRFQVEAVWPQSAEHARLLTEQAVAEGFEGVAAMGGDGIVHHVGQALVDTPATLAVIPTGTTNVYSRLYRIPAKPVAAAKLLVGPHEERALPVLEIEGVNESGASRRLALFAAGFGFDAEVVKAAEGEPYRKYWFGGLHYGRTAIATLLRKFRTREPNLRVVAGDRNAEAVAVLVQIHPAYTYFGRAPLRLATHPPHPITLLIVESLPARRVLRIASTLLTRGDLGTIGGLRVWEEVDSFSIGADPAVEGQADGELTGTWKELTARVLPQALRLIVPISRPVRSTTDPVGSAPAEAL